MVIDNVRSILADMPVAIHAYTVKHDDWYTVVINARIPDSLQREAFKHEILHIISGDFDSCADKTADSIEFTAHLYEDDLDDRETIDRLSC